MDTEAEGIWGGRSGDGNKLEEGGEGEVVSETLREDGGRDRTDGGNRDGNRLR